MRELLTVRKLIVRLTLLDCSGIISRSIIVKPRVHLNKNKTSRYSCQVLICVWCHFWRATCTRMYYLVALLWTFSSSPHMLTFCWLHTWDALARWDLTNARYILRRVYVSFMSVSCAVFLLFKGSLKSAQENAVQPYTRSIRTHIKRKDRDLCLCLTSPHSMQAFIRGRRGDARGVCGGWNTPICQVL